MQNNMSSKERIKNKQIKDYLRKIAKDFTSQELTDIVYIKFNRLYDRKTLGKFLHRNNIEYKHEKRNFDVDKYNYLMSIAKDYTAKELYKISKEKFNETYSLYLFQSYLIRNKIPYKIAYKNKQIARKEGSLPLYSEFIDKRDNVVRVKINDKQWITKQRYVYEKIHNVKLKKNEYVIFLDDNKHNYDIDNLKVVDVKIAGRLKNLKSTNKDITKLSINVAKLKLKIKELEERLL